MMINGLGTSKWRQRTYPKVTSTQLKSMLIDLIGFNFLCYLAANQNGHSNKNIHGF